MLTGINIHQHLILNIAHFIHSLKFKNTKIHVWLLKLIGQLSYE